MHCIFAYYPIFNYIRTHKATLHCGLLFHLYANICTPKHAIVKFPYRTYGSIFSAIIGILHPLRHSKSRCFLNFSTTKCEKRTN